MSKIQRQLVSLTRMVRAVEKGRERLLRSTAALDDTIDIDLIDSAWSSRFQPTLPSRLQELLGDPES